MDHGLKIAAAFSVLVGGLLVALLFRHESPPTEVDAHDSGSRLVLRRQGDPADLSPNAADLRDGSPQMPLPAGWNPSFGLSSQPEGCTTASQTATILRPTSRGEPPPTLPKYYPSTGLSGTTRWGSAIGLTFPHATRADDSVQVHKIADGDTLAALAKRYLGSESRATEIYEANRDLLPSPEVLPIGVELKIPTAPAQPLPLPNVTPERPVAPIP